MVFHLMILEGLIPRDSVLSEALEHCIELAVVEVLGPVCFPVEAVQPHDLVIAELLNGVNFFKIKMLDGLDCLYIV